MEFAKRPNYSKMENNIKTHKDIIVKAAEKYGVSPTVHPLDYIFQFVYYHPGFQSKDDAINYYFMDASNSAKKLSKYLKDICHLDGKEIEMLEFASGYGCVTRHLANELENVAVTSCDIHREAVEFIKKELKSSAIVSNSKPYQLAIPTKYDVIFALSFFSHMPEDTWAQWLEALTIKLKPNGFILFTTHGLESRKHFNDPELDDDGFWFQQNSEQKDLDTDEYGQTVVHPKYVFNKIFGFNPLNLILYEEAAWWGHQDLYIVKKIE